MNGTARTSAAITVTNALPTGVGCAVGIELYAEAHVSVTVDGAEPKPTFEISPESRSLLVEESLRAGLARFFPEKGPAVRLTLKSEIPMGRGLKSSSAVSTAVLLATARAAGRRPTSLEIGLLSAAVGQRTGVSATGALDDALAGLDPGFVVTDNVRGEVLRRSNVDASWGVALYIPGSRHPPSPNLRAAFASERSEGELAARAATSGEWATAMRLNTQLVERTMGYAYGELRDRLRSEGAIASGVCGLGPALAVIAPRARLNELLGVLPSGSGQKFAVGFTRTSVIGGPES